MRPILFRISFLTTANHRLLKNSSHCLPFSTAHPNHQSQNRLLEEEGRYVPVSVWWDFENCNLPINTNAFRVAQGITNVVRANGIKGPIQIRAFGDVMQISRPNQEALTLTGINLCHVPGGKNNADRSLIAELTSWVSQNPPPAHIFLISGDKGFTEIVHKLRMSNYNILLASLDNAPSVLCSAATIMWQWSSLLKGEDLTGKIFSRPPDGPYNSWYGPYKAPIEDPFAVAEHQSSCLPADGLAELGSESKVRPIPKVVIKLIRQILNSNPGGITISQLRSELAKCNCIIDKDLYGYRNFPRFLFAMPFIIKLQPSGRDQYIVRGGNSKFPDESVPAAHERTSEGRSFLKASDEISSGDDIAENSTVSQVPEPKAKPQLSRQHESSLSMNTVDVKVKDYSKSSQGSKKEEKLKESSVKSSMQEKREQDKHVKLQEQLKKVKATSPITVSKDSSEKDEKQVAGPDEVYDSEYGIFRKIWMKWFARDGMNSKAEISKERKDTRNAKDNIKEKNESFEYDSPALFSPSSHEALINRMIPWGDGAVTVVPVPSPSSGLLNKTTSWFKFWSSPKLDDKVGKSGEAIDPVKVHYKELELFSKASFWNEMESFIDTSQGADVFSQSRTRESLAQNIQKQGPLVLKSLPDGDVLGLIDLLISDKKWVEECSSRAFPFRLTRLAGRDQTNKAPSDSKWLSHIFSGSQPILQELGERKHQNPPYTGVQQNVVAHRGSLSKCRNEMLADCQKLVDHILKEHPEGFNMGSFRKLFMEKHGYALDLQQLGYKKLVNLLQIMPGVKIESNLVFPAEPFKNLETDLSIQESEICPVGKSPNESLVPSNKDDDSDSSWDELGPVDNSAGPRITGKTQKGRTEQKLPDYEPLNEDDVSDSEEEPSSCSENEVKSSKLEEERSSLLQILDSWYGDRKEGGDDKKDESVDVKNFMDAADTSWVPSKPSGSGTKTASPGVSHIKRNKPSKSYSFVAEQPGDSKDELVDGILGSLKKSSERSSDSRLLG